MACYCYLKTDHDCPEMLDSYEKQHAENFPKLKFKKNKINSDPRQRQFADDIEEVKETLGGKIPFSPFEFENKIIKFNAVVSYFPGEFTKMEKEVVYELTLEVISKSKTYFLHNGRIVCLGNL